jgi:hypothetical protein
MREMRNANKILVEKPEGKRPLGRQRQRWEDNIRILGKYGVKVWTGCIYIRTGINGREFPD